MFCYLYGYGELYAYAVMCTAGRSVYNNIIYHNNSSEFFHRLNISDSDDGDNLLLYESLAHFSKGEKAHYADITVIAE